MKTIHFLSGLPRSGSTVLAAVLNQHPEMHVSATSGLAPILLGALNAWRGDSAAQATSEIDDIRRVLAGIMQSLYATVSKPVVLDKARGWPEATSLQALGEILGRKPKIIATVRSVPDCAASFVRVAKPEDKEEYLRSGEHIAHLKQSYMALQSGYQLAPECFLFIEYDDLLADPQAQLDRVHEFLGLSPFTYDLSNIDGSIVKERDKEVWGVDGLHDVKPVLEKQHNESAEDVLEHMYDQFVQPRFWRTEDTQRQVHPLDIMLAQGLMGNFAEAEKIGNELAIREPKNHRAAFNRGWYVLRNGHLLDGHKLIYRGRIEKVFGNDPPKSPMPMWDGVSKGTILLNLEGGLGDQIHGVGFVRYMVKRGCKVIVACSGALAMTMREVPGVHAVVQHEAVFGVVHDFWVPSMSAVINLGLQYKDIDGSAYIPKPKVKKGKKFRIGLRWQGNPQFEHEQHRLFPPELLFNAVKDADAEFVSLQRDDGAERRPSWVQAVNLDHWENTRAELAKCDLVITSCTSVAHLAGAMGIPTWIVVPILPYYLWAKPGSKTEWYDSVRLFRQKVYGDWSGAFREVKQELVNLTGEANADQNRVLDSSPEGQGYRLLGLQAGSPAYR